MKQRITNILSSVRPDVDFGAAKDFVEEGVLDSFDVMQLTASLEEEFHVSIDGGEIRRDNFRSIATIEALLKRSGYES